MLGVPRILMRESFMDYLDAVAKIDEDRRMTDEDLMFRKELIDIIRDQGFVTKADIKMIKDYERSLAILNFYAAKIRQQEEGLTKGTKRIYEDEFFEFMISGQWRNFLTWEDEARELESQGVDAFEDVVPVELPKKVEKEDEADEE